MTLSRRLVLHVVIVAFVAGCSRPYQVGDYVLVEWGEDKLLYPAYIIEKKGNARFRVHFEGYPSRWDETISLPRIKGRVEGKVTPPPPPLKVRVFQGLKSDSKGTNVPVSQFKVGDKIKVKWRESVYRASVIDVVSVNEVKVHYEGHESAWDEVVPVSRIVDR